MRVVKRNEGLFVLIIREKGIEENYNSYDEALRAGLGQYGGVLGW